MTIDSPGLVVAILLSAQTLIDLIFFDRKNRDLIPTSEFGASELDRSTGDNLILNFS